MPQTIKDTNKDVTGDKCVCDDKQNLTITDEAKLHAWKEHYQRLFNVEFPWDKNSQEDEIKKGRRTIKSNS